MIPKYCLFLTFIFASGLICTEAQIKPSRHFTEDDGLPANAVRDIARDQHGILWIGTDNGLSAYDGSDFRNLTIADGLASNLVWAVTVDGENRVYAGCYKGGLAVIKDNRVERTFHTVGKKANTFRTLYYSDYYKTVFAGTDYGLYLVQDSTLVSVAYVKDTTEPSIVLAISGKGPDIFFSVLQGTTAGLYRLQADNAFPLKVSAKRLTWDGRFSCMVSGDSLFTGEYNQIRSCSLGNPDKQKILAGADTSFMIWNMAPWTAGRFWVGGLGDGRFKSDILWYDPAIGSLKSLNIKRNDQSVNSILYDPGSEVTWFCRDNGLTAYKDLPFTCYGLDNRETILDIGFSGDSLTVMTQEHIYRLRNNRLVPVIRREEVISRLKRGYDQGLSNSTGDFRICFDWPATFEYNRFVEDGKTLYVNSGLGSLSMEDMKTYLPFGTGPFILMTDGRAFSSQIYNTVRYFPSLRMVSQVKLLSDKTGEFRGVFEMAESDGVVYMATQFNGIYAFREGEVYRLNSSNSVLAGHITDLDQSPEGRIWCSTGEGNIYQVECTDSLRISRVVDLAAAGIVGMGCKWLKFNGEYLFLGTNKGINVISAGSLSSEHPQVGFFFNQENGFEQVSAGSPVNGPDGKLYLHSTDQVICIDRNLVAGGGGSVDIFNLKLDSRESPFGAFAGQTLPFSTRRIDFQFRVIKFPSARNIKYRYQVNSGGWIPGGQVFLQSLRPGNYHLDLEGFDPESNARFTRSESFAVASPFWANLWFILFASVLLAVSVALLFIRRVKMVRDRQEKQTRLLVANSELQMRSLQLQMNPHFLFNALTTIQSFIVEKNTEESLIYLNNLAGFIRTNLENATEEYIRLEEEVDFLNRYASIEQLRFKDRFTVMIRNQIEDTSVVIPPMLIQPVVENAIKHGILNRLTPGLVTVDFRMQNSLLVAVVEDNGAGRKASSAIRRASQHTGKGLSIIQTRLELLNRLNKTDAYRMTITDLEEEGNPAGTRVTIVLAPHQAG